MPDDFPESETQDQYLARRHAEREVAFGGILLPASPSEKPFPGFGEPASWTPTPRKVYIAGPMTGKPGYNVVAFEAAAFLWQRDGWNAVTPFECNSVVWRRHHGRDFDPWKDECDWGHRVLREMMAEDLNALCSADAVAFLAGWEQSKGARLEHALATNLGLPCLDAVTRMPIQPPPETILGEAERLVSHDRQADYGHPIEDFTRTGRIWGAILGIPDVSPDQVALCMVGVKMSREVNKPKRDNRVDMAGYTKTLELVRERQENR